APVRSPGSVSPEVELMLRLLSQILPMIAPPALHCKGAIGHRPTETVCHAIVRGILLPPEFRPAEAVSDCEKKILRRARFFRLR
ncbi:hypothetical protein, partial [Pantoea sp. Ft+CA_17]|uniref:hypothetical protein n=1 Tax=Pantoea sp. Ft+CA_17 TaxID=2929508 RepID=UPI0021179B30